MSNYKSHNNCCCRYIRMLGSPGLNTRAALLPSFPGQRGFKLRQLQKEVSGCQIVIISGSQEVKISGSQDVKYPELLHLPNLGLVVPQPILLCLPHLVLVHLPQVADLQDSCNHAEKHLSLPQSSAWLHTLPVAWSRWRTDPPGHNS